MDNLFILKEQIKELEKLVELKERRIQELQSIIDNNILFPKNPHITLPLNFSVCEHVYPSPWFGTVPPSCMKCGQQSSPSSYIVATSVSVGE